MFPAVASNRSESVLKQKGEMANESADDGSKNEVTVSEPQFSQVCELLHRKILSYTAE